MKNRKLLAFDLLKEKASGCPQSRVPVTVAPLLSVGAQLGPCGVLGVSGQLARELRGVCRIRREPASRPRLPCLSCVLIKAS